MIETSRGIEVADAARFGEEAENHRIRYSELQEAIEFSNAKQSTLSAAMGRKQKLRIGAPQEIQRRVLQDVMVCDDEIDHGGGK